MCAKLWVGVEKVTRFLRSNIGYFFHLSQASYAYVLVDCVLYWFEILFSVYDDSSHFLMAISHSLCNKFSH